MTRLEADDEIYTLESILELSRSGEPYQWFCKQLLPCVVGAKLWHKKHNKELISTIATCSDEAFALLTLENNYERWMAVARWNVDNADLALEDKAPKHYPGSLYTNSGMSKKNGRSRRLQGWAREGYLRFNVFYNQVSRDRRHRVHFENELLTVWQNNNKKTHLHGNVMVTEAEDEIFPANDLVGLAKPKDPGFNASDDESE
jgi:hypothetical protein